MYRHVIVILTANAVVAKKETYQVIDKDFIGAGLYVKVEGDIQYFQKVNGPDEDGDFYFLFGSPTYPDEWRMAFGKNVKEAIMDESKTFYKACGTRRRPPEKGWTTILGRENDHLRVEMETGPLLSGNISFWIVASASCGGVLLLAALVVLLLCIYALVKRRRVEKYPTIRKTENDLCHRAGKDRQLPDCNFVTDANSGCGQYSPFQENCYGNPV